MAEMEKTREQRQQERWVKFLEGISPQARQQLSGQKPQELDDEARSEYLRFRDAQPAHVQQQLDAVRERETPWPRGHRPYYLLFESEDGESPVVRIFTSKEALVSRMHQLEGRDVYVFPVYGILEPFSQGPDRVIFFHDDTAMQFTPIVAEVTLMETERLMQSDGYLGPPELVIVSDSLKDDQPPVKVKSIPKGKPPDDSSDPVVN